MINFNADKIKNEFLEQATILARGTEILPGGVNELAKKLQAANESGKPLRVKLGMDPTRPDLHLGHTVVMRKLKKFQEFGHKIVLIVGAATAMIGDPSGKSDTRPSLTKDEVEANAKTYFEQMSKVVDISNAEVVNNADWLHKLNLVDIVKLASNVTVAQIMARDDFAKRYQENKPISIHEYFYPLMQAYDSVIVDSDIELGGTDQRFNVLLGREIQLAYGKKDPQMVMLLPLLEGTDGIVKMSKSYPEHCVSITDSPFDMYGKIMSIPDELIIRYYSLLTDVSNEELKQIETKLRNSNPRDIKMSLAHLIVEMYYDQHNADSAQNDFINIVQRKSIPDDIPEIIIDSDSSIIELLSTSGEISSKSEIKRLISAGAVKINSEKITDPNYRVLKEYLPVTIQFGKRKFLKVR